VCLWADARVLVEAIRFGGDERRIVGAGVWVWLPHSTQKLLIQPSPGSQERTCSSPAVIEKLPGGDSAVIERAVPERRWQRLQWQSRAPMNGACTAARTAPHMHRPVSGVDSVIWSA
jgi:hypothetical protein